MEVSSSFVLVLDDDFEDDEEDAKNKNAFRPANQGMKAFNEFWRKQFDRLAPS